MTAGRARSFAWHLLAVLLGIGLAAWSWSGERSTMNAVVSRPVREGPGAGEAVRVRREGGVPARAEAHAEAWAQLLVSVVPQAEKTALELRLLGEWADVDLEAALAAALEEGRLAGSDRLLAAFEETMRSDPDRFWPWVRDRHFGPHSRELEKKWIAEVAAHQAEVLAGHLQELGTNARLKAILACVYSVHPDSPDYERMLDRVTALPDTPENVRVWQQAGERVLVPKCTGLELKDKVDEFLRLEGRPGRQQLMMMSLQDGVSRDPQGIGNENEQLARLPEAVRGILMRREVSEQMPSSE